MNVGLAASTAFYIAVATSALAVERQTLRGHVPAAAKRSQPVGRLPGSTHLNLAIGLPLRDQEGLTNLLQQLYDPASPAYRRYLTPEQFAERFGPSKADYEALSAFAKAQGLVVTATHPNRTILDVSGSVTDIERVFHVTMQAYRHPTEDRTFHAPDVEPSVDLTVPLLHVSGLDDFSLPHSLSHKQRLDPNRNPRPLHGSGPGGGFLGNDFRAAYLPGVNLTGVGQSLALVEFEGYYVSDITDYESLAGLPNVPLQNVLVNGFSGDPGSDNGEEAALDIEMAIAMAPGLSKVIVYEGAYPWDDIFNRIATDNAASQISSSWYFYPAGATLNQILQQFAAQGQSFLQASGDFDAYPSTELLTSGGLEAPVDNPLVTSVGGTSLSTSGPGGAWVSETVWNLGYNLGAGFSVGSSGGISTNYAIPVWQQGIDMTANEGSITNRNLPDVAMVADNIWSIADDGDAYAVWGTSAAAPLWAGVIALANQLAEAHGQPPVGFLNPALYALGKGAGYDAALHDITTGNNNSSSSHTGFPAVPGYDLCTGWGTPNGSNLLYALALPELLHILPEVSPTASGPVGGPFSFYGPNFVNDTETFSLTNSGGVPLDWTLASSVSWLDASPNSGTLPAGPLLTDITVSLNASANTMPLGTYPATLWFTNLNDGSVQTRSLTLEVQPKPQDVPIIVAQSTNLAVIEGGTATYTVAVSPASLPVFYNWIRNGIILRDGGNISGATTSTLTISNVSLDDVGVIEVFIKNFYGVATGYAEALTIASPPIIVAQAASQSVLPGATASFTVGAIGTKPLFFQWQNNGTNVSTASNSNVLTLRNVTSANAGAYSVVVSNMLGSVTNAGAVLSLIPDTLPGVGLTTLYSFTGGNDGANPNALIQATNGLLYGTANAGGAGEAGTVFRITTDGALTTLHAFSGGSDGAAPKAGLVQAADGNFYGTTYSGHTDIYFGGTAFRMSASGALSTLHRFTFGGNEGDSPFAALLQAADGNFYGTTFSGGSSNSGCVFKMTSLGTVTTLHSFSGADGANPRGGLTQGSDGMLYGVTKGGGDNPDHGTLFKMTTDGALSTLFRFGGTNGFSPRGGLVLSRDGNFYGTTLNGGVYGRGAVFRMSTTGLLTTLHSFNGEGDGYWPVGALVEGGDGYFYGATSFGGSGGQGTIFRMAPNGQLTTLVYFNGYNGADPLGSLVLATDGSLYGTTLNGGANGDGTVFRLSVASPSSRPELIIAPAGPNIIVSWPTNNGAGFSLQVTLQLGDPAAWVSSPLPEPPIIINDRYVVTIPNTIATPHFYRLSE
jgi:uncharacterized repeat protein (TIGR03803 family)